MRCGQASKAVFPKGFAAMVCAARYRGQSKTQLQAKDILAAINLVPIRQMLQRTQLGLPPRPKRPLSPFARLRPLLAA